MPLVLVFIYLKAKVARTAYCFQKFCLWAGPAGVIFVVLLGRRREWHWCYSETRALCVPPHLAFCSFPHNSGLCWLCFINNRRSQHWYFLFLLCLCLWKEKQNREGRKNRSLQCPFQTWHKLDCVVPNGIHETKEICIAEQHQTYPLHLSQAYCPDTGQMPSVLVLFLSRFLLDYLLPSYPSLGIFIWTWNFLSIPGKVRGTPRRRSNGSTCPSGRSWAIEGNFIVYVPAF